MNKSALLCTQMKEHFLTSRRIKSRDDCRNACLVQEEKERETFRYSKADTRCKKCSRRDKKHLRQKYFNVDSMSCEILLKLRIFAIVLYFFLYRAYVKLPRN